MSSNSEYLSEVYQSPCWVAQHDTKYRRGKVANDGVYMGNEAL